MKDGWAGFEGEVCEAAVCERSALVFVNDILWLCLGTVDGMWGVYYVVVVVVGGVERHLWGVGGGRGTGEQTKQRKETITSWKKSSAARNKSSHAQILNS